MVLAALVSSCATGYRPAPYWNIHETAFTGLVPGVTTKEEVLGRIGEPLVRSYFPRQNEEVLEYRYVEGVAMIMLAYLYFDSRGIYKYLSQMPDPAFIGGQGDT